MPLKSASYVLIVTLNQPIEILAISQERVRQIASGAITKLRYWMEGQDQSSVIP